MIASVGFKYLEAGLIQVDTKREAAVSKIFDGLKLGVYV